MGLHSHISSDKQSTMSFILFLFLLPDDLEVEQYASEKAKKISTLVARMLQSEST